MLVLLLLAIGFTMLVLFVLLAQIVTEAWPVVQNQGLDFITGTIGSNPATIGIWPGLYGSFFIGLGVVVVSIPLGVAAAIYLEEYASSRNRLTRVIMVNIRNLAGVPAVIYGVLGFTIFVGWLDPITGGETVLAAALTMAVLVLPIVIITSIEAIEPCPARAARRRIRRRRVPMGGHPRSRPAVRRSRNPHGDSPLDGPGPRRSRTAHHHRRDHRPPAVDEHPGPVHGAADADLQLVGSPRRAGCGDRLEERGGRGGPRAAHPGPVLQRRCDPAAQPLREATHMGPDPDRPR